MEALASDPIALERKYLATGSIRRLARALSVPYQVARAALDDAGVEIRRRNVPGSSHSEAEKAKIRHGASTRLDRIGRQRDRVKYYRKCPTCGRVFETWFSLRRLRPGKAYCCCECKRDHWMAGLSIGRVAFAVFLRSRCGLSLREVDSMTLGIGHKRLGEVLRKHGVHGMESMSGVSMIWCDCMICGQRFQHNRTAPCCSIDCYKSLWRSGYGRPVG